MLALLAAVAWGGATDVTSTMVEPPPHGPPPEVAWRRGRTTERIGAVLVGVGVVATATTSLAVDDPCPHTCLLRPWPVVASQASMYVGLPTVALGLLAQQRALGGWGVKVSNFPGTWALGFVGISAFGQVSWNPVRRAVLGYGGYAVASGLTLVQHELVSAHNKDAELHLIVAPGQIGVGGELR